MGTLISSHSSELGEWEMTVRLPHRLLLPYIRRYCGYVENTSFSSRLQAANGEGWKAQPHHGDTAGVEVDLVIVPQLQVPLYLHGYTNP